MDERSLEGFLGFSDDDLAANRAGRLSSSQSGRLRWGGIWRLIVGPTLFVVATVIALVVTLAFLALIALAVAGYGLYLTWRGFAFMIDGHDGAVAHVTGPLRRRMVRGKNGASYWAEIGPVSKRIKLAAYGSLPGGLTCHLYYAPGCRSLLSIEPASAEEAKPDHPFGPDSAHAWDRLRGSWVLITIGVLGLLVGAHAIATAHPALPFRVGGTIADYVETHGKTTTRTIYLDGNPSAFTPEREDYYTPPVPPFGLLIGREVVLYIDAGTSNVIALNDGEQLHASDWYLHPEHETVFDVTNGGVVAAVSAIAIVVGIALIAFGRRRAGPAAADASAQPPLYAPPTVRPVLGFWPSALIIVAVGAIVITGLAFAAHP